MKRNKFCFFFLLCRLEKCYLVQLSDINRAVLNISCSDTVNRLAMENSQCPVFKEKTKGIE